MVDLDLVRANPKLFEEACKNKNIALDIGRFLKLDEERRVLMTEAQKMQSERNAVSKSVPTIKDKTEKEKTIAAMKELAEELKMLQSRLQELTNEWTSMQLQLPSIPLKKVPVGKDEKENVEVRKVGELPKFSFAPKDHVTLGRNLKLFDIERGVKVAGARSYFLTGDGARLHLAILRYTLDLLIQKGFRTFVPPLMVLGKNLTGTGFFPGSEEQIYSLGVRKGGESGEVEADDLYLIGTSEVSVMGFHADEVLERESLPLKYCGTSSCFRREAGTYGKDTQGLYRIHQFEKVEQVIIAEADEEKSLALFEEIRANAEEVLQALKLPYRLIDVCTGDMGRAKVYMQDIETWMPSRNSYGETHSCSFLGDFQTRRLGIKYKAADGTKKFCHSLNNTCIASPRILIPILEIYQNEDGSVTVPEVLRPYMGGQKKIG